MAQCKSGTNGNFRSLNIYFPTLPQRAPSPRYLDPPGQGFEPFHPGIYCTSPRCSRRDAKVAILLCAEEMGTFSTERLIHYLSATRGADSKAATDVCVEATADPGLYEFGELLSAPPIAALKGTNDHKYYELLRLFAHGTLDDYRAATQSFPPFSEAHWKKLRTLTLVSLANGNNVLQYDVLRQRLALDTVREVEDVVLDAVYTGLVRAKMNQREGRVEIISAVGRDVVMPEGVSEMITMLKGWVQRSTQLVEEIDDKINYIASHTATVAKLKAETTANKEAARKMLLADVALAQMKEKLATSEYDVPSDELMQQWDIHSHPPMRPDRWVGPKTRR